MNGKLWIWIRTFTVGLLLLAIPAICTAHPETGSLPDSSAETEYRIVVEINPNDVHTRNKLGMVLYRKNKLDEAARQFVKVIEISSRDFDAHNGMGLVSCKNGRYREAVDWFVKAIAIRPDETMVSHGLGLAYEHLGNLSEAEKFYRQAQLINERNLHKGLHRQVEKNNKKTVANSLLKLKAKRAKTGGKI